MTFFYQSILLKRPRLSALFLGVIFLLLASGMPRLKLDASSDSLVLEGDKSLAIYRQVIKQYGGGEFLFVAYRPKQEKLLSAPTFERLQILKDRLAALPEVSKVTTILDVPLLYSPPVTIGNFSEGFNYLSKPEGLDLQLVEQEFKNSPVYRDLIMNQDATICAIQINLAVNQDHRQWLDKRENLRELKREKDLNGEQLAELLQAEAEVKLANAKAMVRQAKLISNVRSILAEEQAYAEVFLGGVPMIAVDMIRFIESDLVTFGTLIIVFMILLLVIIFRQFNWVLLPTLACVLTTAGMLGLLGWMDWRLTVISSNFVALLLILTLSITIHLAVRFREMQSSQPQVDKNTLIIRMVRFMAKPCLYTTLTTIVAFLSLIVSGIRPVIDFGWMMTMGCSMALLVTFLVLPLGLSLLPVKAPKAESEKQTKPFTAYFAVVVDRFGKGVGVLSVLLLCFSVWGISLLKVENRFIDYFDASTEIYQGMELIDSQLGGTIPLDIILKYQAPDAAKMQLHDTAEQEDSSGVDSKTETIETDDDFFDDDKGESDFFDEEETIEDFSISQDKKLPFWFSRAGLNKIETLHDYLDSLEETGKVLSLATTFKVAKDIIGSNVDDIHLSLLYKSLSGEERAALISPYLAAESDETRLSIRVKETSHTLSRAQLLSDIDQYLKDSGYSEDEYELTGMLVLYNNMLQSLFRSQITTLGAVFIAIMLMFAVLFRSLLVSLIAITPNLLAAAIVLGGMGLAGIPLDMMTITIAAITVGIGVDDTIHYIHRFKSEITKDGDYMAAMYRSHMSIGRAMYYTSITIVVGFSILALSNFTPSIYFGLLTSLAMLAALMGALLLLPLLIVTIKPFAKVTP